MKLLKIANTWPAPLLDNLDAEHGPVFAVADKLDRPLLEIIAAQHGPIAVYPGPTTGFKAILLRQLVDLPQVKALVCDALPEELQGEHADLWAIIREKYFFIPASLQQSTAAPHPRESSITVSPGSLHGFSDPYVKRWLLIAETINQLRCDRDGSFEGGAQMVPAAGTLCFVHNLQTVSPDGRRAAGAATQVGLTRMVVDDLDIMPHPSKQTLRADARHLLRLCKQSPRRGQSAERWFDDLKAFLSSNVEAATHSWSNFSRLLREPIPILEASAVGLHAQGLLPPPRASQLSQLVDQHFSNLNSIDLIGCQDLHKIAPDFADACFQRGTRSGGETASAAAHILFKALANGCIEGQGLGFAQRALELLNQAGKLREQDVQLKLALGVCLGERFDHGECAATLTPDSRSVALWTALKAWFPVILKNGKSSVPAGGIEAFCEGLSELDNRSEKPARLGLLKAVAALYLTGVEAAQQFVGSAEGAKSLSSGQMAGLGIHCFLLGHEKEAAWVWEQVPVRQEPSTAIGRFLVSVADCLVHRNDASKPSLQLAFENRLLPKRHAPDNSVVFYYALALQSIGCRRQSDPLRSLALRLNPIAPIWYARVSSKGSGSL